MREMIHRCMCGAWRYEGNNCAICAKLRGDIHVVCERTDEDLPNLQR